MRDLEAGGGPDESPEPIRARKTRKKPETLASRKHHEQQQGQRAAVGKLLPACPMTAGELAEAWTVGREDVEEITVKVLKVKTGTQEQELVKSVPLVEFDGEEIAGQFGPGMYYLRPAAGPYAKHAAKLPISDHLARACGWGQLPPTASELAAERTLRQATQGPTNPVDLMAAIEQVIEARERKSRIDTQIQTNPVQQDPMQGLKSQFEQIQTMMAFMSSLEERAIKTVEMRMGKQEVNMSAEDTNTSLLEKLLPKALDIFGDLMKRREPAPIVHVPPPGPGQVERQAVAEVALKPEPEVLPMPNLTEVEQRAIAGPVSMLRPFAGNLVELAAGPFSDEQIVDELEGFIPGAMVPGLESLAAVVAKHGPAVLGVIHPGLAVDRWASILPKLVERCKE